MDEQEYEYNPELPKGYVEAREKYPEFVEESVQDIWSLIALWRDYEKGSPRFKAKLKPVAYQQLREADKRTIEEFKARILEATLEDDKIYLNKFFKALQMPTKPRREMYGARAALDAFENLFMGMELVSRDDWPTKQEVRRCAEEILRKAGRPLPSERHWPRIFNQAGLSDLLSVTFGPGRRRPASGTK